MTKWLRAAAGWIEEQDVWLLGAVLALCLLGTLMVYEAVSYEAGQRPDGPGQYGVLQNQLVRLGIGLVALVGASFLDHRRLRRRDVNRRLLGLALGLAALAVVLHGVGGYGRWLRISVISLQPVELVKLAVILYLAERLADPYLRLAWDRELAKLLAVPAAAMVLIALQPNYSNAAVLGALTLLLLLLAGAPWPLLGRLVAPALALGVVGFLIVEKLRARLVQWLDCLRHEEPTYQVLQALIGLGAGGWLGQGIGGGHQRFYFLPELHTDFILTVVGEELGFAGAAGLVALQVLVAWRGLLIAERAPDRFGRLTAAGLACMLFMYAFLNIAMVTGLVPVMGLPLPFVSFGGSALVTNLAAVGLLLSIDRRTRAAPILPLRAPHA